MHGGRHRLDCLGRERLLGLGFLLERKDDSVSFVDAFICSCDNGEMHVWDGELLVDAVEESLAEGAIGEIGHDAVEEADTG
jgi:hypothetical protein